MRLGLTIGDAAGIGPEIIDKALIGRPRDVVVYGAPALFDGDLEVVDPLPGMFEPVRPGEAQPYCARLQLAALELAITDAKAGRIDAIVTAPWTKSLFETIDAPVVGHTEVLAEGFGVGPRHVMMLAGDVLRVALVTTHLPLRDVAAAITIDRIVQTIQITGEELQQSFGIAQPRLAACGINPHASERGHIGTEDLDVTMPAIEQARRAGWDVSGPYPADTLFPKFRGEQAPFDAVIAMYHDQGLIPLKLRHFGASANITLGLPTIRTSVDHGSAWDIAGQGIADPSSMIYAIETARRLVANRRTR